jgi:O-antigen/teichoic acid export membrane protein
MEKHTRARKILQNFGFLTLGKTLGDAFFFLFFVVLSRFFGPEGIGQYSFAVALTGFFAVFSDFGLYSFSVKELSRRTNWRADYYSQILSLRVILSAVAFGMLLLILPFLPFPRELKLIIVIIGAYQVISTLVSGFAAVFVAREDMLIAGLIEASLKAAAALAGITVVMAGADLVTTLAILPAVTAGQLLVAYVLVTKKYGRPRLVASTSSLTRLVREAMPYAFSLFLFMAYSRVDVVFLGFLIGMAAAGVYNVAYRVVFFLTFIPQFAAVALFPLASRLYTKSREELEALYLKSLNLTILIGLPVASGVWLIAPDLIELIFGPTFAESASVLRILVGFLFLTFLSRIMSVFLMSCDRQVEMTREQLKAALVNVLGNMLLIPVLGVAGAAVATLISETLMVILFAVRVRPVLGWPNISSRLVIGGVGVASFCLPFTLLPSLPLGVVIPASVLLYLVTLALFREIRKNELRTLLSILKGELGREVPIDQEVP